MKADARARLALSLTVEPSDPQVSARLAAAEPIRLVESLHAADPDLERRVEKALDQAAAR